jgi:hypothetical protein
LKKFYLIIPVLLLLTFSACLNVKREIKIDGSGKGTEKMTLGLGKEFMRLIIGISVDQEKEIDYKYLNEAVKVPGIKLNKVNTSKGEDSSKIIKIDYSFDDVSVIGSAFQGELAAAPNVTYNIIGDSVYFKYKVNFSQREPGDTTSSEGDDIDLNYFVNDKYNISIDFPYKVVFNNGSSTTERKVIWEFPMQEILGNKPIFLKVVIVK